MLQCMHVEDLRKEINGQTVTEIDEKSKTITLANGEKLHFVEQKEGFTWYSIELYDHIVLLGYHNTPILGEPISLAC